MPHQIICDKINKLISLCTSMSRSDVSVSMFYQLHNKALCLLLSRIIYKEQHELQFNVNLN